MAAAQSAGAAAGQARTEPALDLRVRVWLGEDIAIGPGKADLLDAIAAEGSISAAARRLGMSYRRAWLLVETMNRAFATPLVRAQTGGPRGGGAEVTALGRDVLARYRALQQAVAEAAGTHYAALRSLLAAGGGPEGPATSTEPAASAE